MRKPPVLFETDENVIKIDTVLPTIVATMPAPTAANTPAIVLVRGHGDPQKVVPRS
jgi:hypothetical protein